MFQGTHRVLAIAVVLATFGSGTARAQGTVNDLTSETIECLEFIAASALLVGGGNPIVVPIVVTDTGQSQNWGQLERDPPLVGDPLVLTIFIRNYNSPRTNWGKVGGYSQDYAKGLVLRTVAHELLHACMGPLESECDNDARSCLHALIDVGTHAALCAAAREFKAEKAQAQADNDRAAAMAADQKLKGACESAKFLEDKWNGKQGVEDILACKSGGGDCPLDPDTMKHAEENCNLSFPCPPTGGDEVLEACDACL